MNLRQNEFLFVQGDAGDRLYIVRTGLLRRFRRIHDQIQNLGESGPGTVLGEMALLDNASHDFTAQALEDCVITPIPQESLQKELSKHPRWLAALLYALLQKIKRNQRHQHNQSRTRAFPALLWCLQYSTAPIELMDLCQQMHILCTIEEWDTRQLILALERLGIVHNKPAQGQEFISLRAPAVVNRVTEVLLARSRHQPDPSWVLSAGEQRILDCWQETARRHGLSQGALTQVTQEQFQQCLHEHMPGVKLGVSALKRLQKNQLIQIVDQSLLANYDVILEILDSLRLLQRIETELPYLLENF